MSITVLDRDGGDGRILKQFDTGCTVRKGSEEERVEVGILRVCRCDCIEPRLCGSSLSFVERGRRGL